MTEITDNLIATLESSLTPKRSTAPIGILLQWLTGSVLYVTLLLLHFELRPDLAQKLHAPLFLAEILSLVGLVVASGISAAALSFPDLHQKKWLAYLPAFPFAAFLAVITTAWLSDSTPPPPTAQGMDCLLCISLFTALPAIWMLYLLRKQASTHVLLAGAITLIAASSLGCLTLRLSEQTDSITHVVEWHYLPIIGFALLGMILGKRFLKW